MTVLRGMGRLAMKVNVTFFVGIEVLNIFHLTIFFFEKKNNIFQNEVPNTVFKFFLKNPHTIWLKHKITGFVGTFSPISVILLGRLFSKTIGFTHERTRTNHVNFMKIKSTATYVCHKFLCILTLQISNQGLLKQKMLPPRFKPFWSRGCQNCQLKILRK